MLRLGVLALLSGIAWSGTAEGKAALAKGDYATARKELTAAAEAGDAEAQFQVGEIYRRGLGVRASSRLALKSHEAAAAQGHKGAAGELGIHLWKMKKRDEAIKRLREGADGGHMRSQYWLAMLDYEGVKEVGLKEEERRELFHKAAQQGHPDAQERYAYALRSGKVGGAVNLDEAEKWYRKAADQGHEGGYSGLSHCLFKKKRRREAIEMQEKAALGGNYISQHFLALSYLKRDRYAESYAWATVGSTTKNAWPAKSKIMAKLHKDYAKSLKVLTKGAREYTSPDEMREGKKMAKRYIKEIKAKLKAGRPWEEPDV